MTTVLAILARPELLIYGLTCIETFQQLLQYMDGLVQETPVHLKWSYVIDIFSIIITHQHILNYSFRYLQGKLNPVKQITKVTITFYSYWIEKSNALHRKHVINLKYNKNDENDIFNLKYQACSITIKPHEDTLLIKA